MAASLSGHGLFQSDACQGCFANARSRSFSFYRNSSRISQIQTLRQDVEDSILDRPVGPGSAIPTGPETITVPLASASANTKPCSFDRPYRVGSDNARLSPQAVPDAAPSRVKFLSRLFTALNLRPSMAKHRIFTQPGSRTALPGGSRKCPVFPEAGGKN